MQTRDRSQSHRSEDGTASVPAPQAVEINPVSANERPAPQRFAKWDGFAAIRTKPRQRLQPQSPGATGDITYFSPDLVPLAAHPLIGGRGLGNQILLQHLYRYLHFTAILEQQFVNPLMIRIASQSLGFDLPNSMVIDAYRIYCDEGYHALCAADIAQQIEDRTGIVQVSKSQPQAFLNLGQIVAAAPGPMQPFLELAFVIVSETLVSAILTKAHLDTRVEPAIRQVILEHAQDEAVHGAYFSDLTKVVWPQMSPEIQLQVGCALPQLILSFLGPDLPHVGRVLRHFGYSDEEVGQMIAECFPRSTILASIRTACTVTIGLFRSLGALDNAQIAATFHESGLLDGA